MYRTLTYLGDGLYASYDGLQVCLMANGIDHDATDKVYLEEQVLNNFKEWIKNGFPDYKTNETI